MKLFSKKIRYWLASILLLFSLAIPVLQSTQVLAKRIATSATLNGGSSVSVNAGDTIAVQANVTTSNNAPGTPNWRSTRWMINTVPSTTFCVEHADHDGAGSYSESFNVTAPVDPGLYSFRFRAYESDGCTGNEDQFNLDNSITVVAPDVTPPVISGTPADFSVEATSSAGAIATYTNPTALDDLDGQVPVNCVPASGLTFPLGPTTVTCTATDSSNNSSQTQFVVTVVDSTPPVVQGKNPLSGDFLSDGLNIRAQASDSNTGINNVTFQVINNINVTVSGPTPMLHVNANNYRFIGFNTNTLADGVYTFRFIATNNALGTASYDSTNVTVDNTNPTASIDSPVGGIYVNGNVPIVGSFSDPNIQDYKVLVATQAAGTTCQDDTGDPNIVFSTGWVTSGDQTNATLASYPSASNPDGKYLAVLCARDKAGNRVRAHNGPQGFNVDNTPPVISNVPSDQTIEVMGSGSVATWTDPTATDSGVGGVTVVCSPLSGSFFPIGTTVVTCTASDSLGNSSSVNFNITVVDTTPPVVPQNTNNNNSQDTNNDNQANNEGRGIIPVVLGDNGNKDDGKVKTDNNQNSNNQNDKSNKNWWWILLLFGVASMIGFIIYKQSKEEE